MGLYNNNTNNYENVNVPENREEEENPNLLDDDADNEEEEIVDDDDDDDEQQLFHQVCCLLVCFVCLAREGSCIIHIMYDIPEDWGGGFWMTKIEEGLYMPSKRFLHLIISRVATHHTSKEEGLANFFLLYVTTFIFKLSMLICE